MGLSQLDLQHLIAFRKQGLLREVSSLLDIGATQVVGPPLEASLLGSLGEAFGRPGAPHPSPSSYARALWEACGIDYTSIDLSPEAGALPLDLNFADCPPALKEHFQLVTNFGTTEHVCNQLNAFRFIHDCAAPGGCMYHVVPFSGYQNHGLFSYNPKFFWMLCRSNNYEYLNLEMNFVPQAEGLHPDIQASLESFWGPRALPFSTHEGCLRVFLRKPGKDPFVPPFDGLSEVPESYRRMFI